jgi:hypothetical protein
MDFLVSFYLLRMTTRQLTTLFPTGARWMYDRMQELRPSDLPFDPGINYTGYGLLKYGACLAGFALAILPSAKYGLFTIPLSIASFYVVEVHFLFLFPLLIDQTPRPLLTGIRIAWSIGIGRCLITVIPIATYMMLGLFRRSDPFSNWYTGCLKIITWYDHEIRDRI